MSKPVLEVIGGDENVRVHLEKHLRLLYDLSSEELVALEKAIPTILQKVSKCWGEISNKYYNRDGVATLDILNSNQYAQLLLILARIAHEHEAFTLADKVFGLNKMLNSIDIYHAVELPESFYIDHTLGVVVGRAKFSKRLFLSQHCTIGSNPGSPDYPDLGEDNYLMAGATLVGNVKSGDRVIYAAGSYVKDMEIPSDSIVFGRDRDVVIKPLKEASFKTASPFLV